MVFGCVAAAVYTAAIIAVLLRAVSICIVCNFSCPLWLSFSIQILSSNISGCFLIKASFSAFIPQF